MKGPKSCIIQILNHLKIGLLDVFTNSRKIRIDGIQLFYMFGITDQFKIELRRCWNGIFSLYTIYICHKIPQELVMLYKWMIGSCDFSNDKC